jgi:aspartate/methionine/tyrosine aminotransferase
MAFISDRSKYAANPLREDDRIVAELRAKGKRVVSLNIGNPPLYFPTPKYIVDAYVDALKKGKTAYAEADGVPELREAIAKRYKRMYDVDATKDDVIVTQGISEGLEFINCAMINPGDYAVLFVPYYVQYIVDLKLFGGNPIICNYNENRSWDVDTDALERSIKKEISAGHGRRIKYMMLTNPDNPTGKVLERRTLKRIVDIANDNGIFIVSDEIYDEIVYNGARFTSVAEVAKGMPYMILNGASKNFDATGFRLGFALLPEKDKKSMQLKEKLKEYAAVRLSSNVPAQYALAAAMNNVKAHSAAIKKMREEIQDRANYATDLLERNPYLKTQRPNGAFYIFSKVDLKALGFKTDKEFADALLEEEHVQIVRGSGFGLPSHIRIVALAPKEILGYAINKLNGFCERHAKS